MSTTPWEDFAKRSRELYEQQAELAKTWLAGQSKLAGPGLAYARSAQRRRQTKLLTRPDSTTITAPMIMSTSLTATTRWYGFWAEVAAVA